MLTISDSVAMMKNVLNTLGSQRGEYNVSSEYWALEMWLGQNEMWYTGKMPDFKE